MTATFLTPDDPRWTAFLHRVVHDVYHLPGYVAAAAVHEGGTPAAFFAEADGHALLIPLLLHPLPPALNAPPDWHDAASPYGYPGPLLTPGCPPDTFEALLHALRREAAARSLVSLFLRLHPLLPVPLSPLAAIGDVRRHGPTVYLDLEAPARYRRDHRSGLRKLRQAGYTLQMDAWEHEHAFRTLYAATMTRVRAEPFYRFDGAYFTALRERLPGALHLATVHAPGGDVAAAALVLTAGPFAAYHLSGSADRYRADAPAKLLVDGMRRWGRAQGLRVLHLGGGVGGSADSLLLFKQGFSDRTAPFHTVRVILDPGRYPDLTARAGTASPASSGFFPAYRRHRPRAAASPPAVGC